MKAQTVLEALDELFPDAHCELEHADNYQMAVAVVLSAQTTDASVNRVTPALFEQYPDAFALAQADLPDIERCIASLGLYRNKAKAIQGMARGMVERFDGAVPDSMEELVSLPGVGRKCANVIMSECYGLPALAVDTHVSRVSRQAGSCKTGRYASGCGNQAETENPEGAVDQNPSSADLLRPVSLSCQKPGMRPLPV